MKLGFHRKIYLVFFVLLMIQGLIIFIWLSQVMKSTVMEEIKHQAIFIGKSLSLRMEKPMLDKDFLRMRILAHETLNLDDNIVYAFVLDSTGHLLVHTFKKRFPSSLKKANTIADKKKDSMQLGNFKDQLIYDYAVPVTVDGNRLGILRLGISRKHAEKMMKKIMFSTAVTIIIAIFLAGIVGTLLLNPVVKSIHKLYESSELSLQTILDAIPDFISLQSPDGRYISVNKAFCKTLDKTQDEIIGKFNHDLFPQIPADQYNREDKNVIKTGIPLVKEKKTAGQKEIKWIHVVKIPVIESTGHVKGLVCSGRDITRLKAVQDQLTHAQKMESVGRLAAGVAHEINTPLGVILGYAQILLEDVKKDGQIYKDVSIIVKQTRNCSKIVSDLLNFSRPGKSNITEFNINDALEEILGVVTHTFSLNHVRVLHEFYNDPLLMKGDKEKLKQVFINLLNNAFDAIGHTGSIYIRTSAGKTEDNIKISISDTGCGISKDNIKKIFEPFYTTKGPDQGTGLGLSVTFGIIKEHNGIIKVFSPPLSGINNEQGTQFIILLPTGLNKKKGNLNGKNSRTG